MAVEAAQCLLEELRSPRKATVSMLSSEDGKFSWGNVTEDMHLACIGKMASNDVPESPFAALTRQLQAFGRVLGIHAAAIGHARVNGDFNIDGAYHQLTPQMRESLVHFAVSKSPEIRKRAIEPPIGKERGKEEDASCQKNGSCTERICQGFDLH